MTSIAKATASSSSSVMSESLQSDSYESAPFPAEISPPPIEEDIEQRSYDDEAVEDATFIAPSMSWQEPGSPVSIIVPKPAFCNVSEVRGEVQRLEDEISQGDMNATQVKEEIDPFGDHSLLYLDANTASLLDSTPRTAQAITEYMPAEYIIVQESSKSTEDFQDWQPDLFNKKRGRDDLYSSKGKGVGHSRLVDYSSDGVPTEIEAGTITAIYHSSKAAQSSNSIQDDFIANEDEEAVSKRKIVLSKPMKYGKKGQPDSGWQQREQHQWRKMVNLNIPEDPKRRSHWPPWLHPAFRIEGDEIVPRISYPDLQM
jgi:hypothetical protein